MTSNCWANELEFKEKVYFYAKKIGVELPEKDSKASYSIAEIFNQKKNIEVTSTSKFGFI